MQDHAPHLKHSLTRRHLSLFSPAHMTCKHFNHLVVIIIHLILSNRSGFPGNDQRQHHREMNETRNRAFLTRYWPFGTVEAESFTHSSQVLKWLTQRAGIYR